MDTFTREELWNIERKCERALCDGMNPAWIKAYNELAHAACVLDAFIARSSVPGNPGEDPSTEQLEAQEAA
jgi:hypothetical protein